VGAPLPLIKQCLNDDRMRDAAEGGMKSYIRRFRQLENRMREEKKGEIAREYDASRHFGSIRITRLRNRQVRRGHKSSHFIALNPTAG